MKLLLVGEDDDTRRAIGTFLEELPFNKFTKTVDLMIEEFDSVDAVHQWLALDPNRITFIDLIIAEQYKSGLNGAELIKELFPERLSIPAIIYCNDIATDIKNELINSDKAFFLELPVTCKLLKEMMEKIATTFINARSREVESRLKSLGSKMRRDDCAALLENILMHNIRTLLDYQRYAPWIALPSLSLGKAYLRNGKFEEAIPYLKRAIEIDFGLLEAHEGLALCYRKTGRSFEERAELEIELKESPNSPELLLKVGEASLREGDYEDAVNYFKKAIKHHKAHHGNRLKAKVHVGLGRAYFDDGIKNDDDGKIHKAKDEFQTAIEVDPLLIATYNNLIIVYRKLGMNDEAKSVVAKVEKITPESADGWLELFRVYLYDGESSKAKYSLQKAIIYLPDNISILITAGDIYLHQFMFYEAAELFEKALYLNPSDPHIYNCLGICFKRLRHINKAIEYYHKALKFTPDDPCLHYNLGKAYYQGENISLARKEYEIALKLGLEVNNGSESSTSEVEFPDFFDRREEERRHDGVPSNYVEGVERRIGERRIEMRRKSLR